MDDIIKKLLAGWVPNDIIEQLKAWLWNTFETELVNNGLKAAWEKIGIDTEHLPNIDLTNLKEVITTDITSKKEVTEMIEKVGEITKYEEGFFGKLKAFFYSEINIKKTVLRVQFFCYTFLYQNLHSSPPLRSFLLASWCLVSSGWEVIKPQPNSEIWRMSLV